MIVEVKLAERLVKFRLIGTQLQSGLIFFDGAVEILAQGEAFRAKLVSAPGVWKRFLELCVSCSSERLVGAREPVAGLGVFAVDARHLPQCIGCRFVLLRFKISSSQQ